MLMIRQAASDLKDDQIPKIYLLEFDERFGVFPEFVFYDFKNPFKLPGKLCHSPKAIHAHQNQES